MDPLSTTASIIAIVQLGSAVCSGFHRITSLRETPEILLQLNNDVADLQAIINAISKLPLEIIQEEIVCAALRKARDAILEVDTLIVYDLLKASSISTEVKIDRVKWLTADGKIQRSRLSLQKARSELQAATIIANAASTSAIDLRTQKIESQLQQLHVTARHLLVQAEESQETLGLLMPIVPSIQVLQSQYAHLPQSDRPEVSLSPKSIKNTEAILPDQSCQIVTDETLSVSSKMTRPFSRLSVVQTSDIAVDKADRPQDTVWIHLSPFAKCSNVSCTCVCHRQTRRRTPKALELVLGSLFIGYSSLPFIKPACDTIGCRSRVSASTISYAFPRWFINYKLLFMAMSKPYSGPELLFRVLRPRPNGSRIFTAAIVGRLSMLKRILEEGSGSLMDVDENGSSVLLAATTNSTWRVVEFLLQLGSDCFQENNLGISPYLYYWHDYLTNGKRQSKGNTLYGSFDPIAFEFSNLHAAILDIGIVPAKTAIELVSRVDIDARDRLGITALGYAVKLGDAEIVEALLLKGADPSCEDHEGWTSLCHAVALDRLHIVRILLAAGADPHQLAANGKTLLAQAVISLTGTSMMDCLYECGVDINARDMDGKTPLINLVIVAHEGSDNHIFVQTLLWLVDRGADINAQDSTGESALSIALTSNSHSILALLLELGADHMVVNITGETLLHSAAIYGDIKSLLILRVARLKSLNIVARSNNNKMAIHYAQLRTLDPDEWSYRHFTNPEPDPDEWYQDFKGLSMSIAVLQANATARTSGEHRDSQQFEEQLDENDQESSESDSDEHRVPGAFPDA